MRTHVSFRHPVEFVPLSKEDSVLGVDGAQWFRALLGQVPDLQIEDDLCQEDWGVVLFARRDQKRFWIGLSSWGSESTWLAHFQHGSFAWWQRLSASGKSTMQRFLIDVHEVLSTESVISDIVWYNEGETRKSHPIGFPTPV